MLDPVASAWLLLTLHFPAADASLCARCALGVADGLRLTSFRTPCRNSADRVRTTATPNSRAAELPVPGQSEIGTGGQFVVGDNNYIL